MKTLIVTTICLFAASFLFGQCEANQAELDAIKEKYEQKFQLVEDKGEEIGDDAPEPDNGVEAAVQVDFDIEMIEQHFALDVIAVTMKDKKLSLDLPQITMETKSIYYDEVYTKNVLKKTGQYAEIHCKDTWIYVAGIKTKGVPECTTVWKDILTHVPELHTRTVEIKTDLPVITKGRTEIITAIPEFKMMRQDIYMKLPSITVKDVKAETKKMEQEAQELQNYSQDLVAEQKKEFSAAISGNFSCQRETLLNNRNEISEAFANSATEIDLNINELKASGFNPANLKSSDGGTVNLYEIKDLLAEKEKIAVKSIDDAISDLNAKEKETIDTYFTN